MLLRCHGFWLSYSLLTLDSLFCQFGIDLESGNILAPWQAGAVIPDMPECAPALLLAQG